MNEVTRRTFIVGAGSALTLGRVHGHQAPVSGNFRGPICFFSKHLPDLHWKDLGPVVKSAGFDGIDLTVRPNGHVLPERAKDELEPAIRKIRESGVKLPMLTTALLSADEDAAEPILATAGRLQVPFIKPGYYRYELKDIRSELADVERRLSGLAALAKRWGG